MRSHLPPRELNGSSGHSVVHRAPIPLAVALQRAVGNRAVTALIGSPTQRVQTAGRAASMAATVQRDHTHVILGKPSDYGLKADDDPAGVNLPKADHDPTVALDDEDSQHSVRTTMSKVQGTSYVDNSVVSVGVDLTDVWTLGIQALVFRTRAGGELRIALSDIDFVNTIPADHYVKRGGVIYPVRADGGFAFDQLNAPTILRGALIKLQQQEELRGQRLVIAQTVMAFQLNLASLASAVAPDTIANAFEGLAPEVSTLGPRLARTSRGIGAAEEGVAAEGGAAAKEAWFNPRSLRDNCVGAVCAVIKTKADRATVTEAEIAAGKAGESSPLLSGKTLDLAAAKDYIFKATGKTLGKEAVDLSARNLEPGGYAVFGGNSTASLRHVVYATVKADGRVVIYDPQVATKMTWYQFLGKYGRGSRAYRILD